jgi:hypothetical protein
VNSLDCGKFDGTGSSSDPSSCSSAAAASHMFWCIVSRASRNDSRSRTPWSSVMW